MVVILRNTIDVTIPQGYGSYNSFLMNYKTKITNEQQKEFVNILQACGIKSMVRKK